MTWIERAANRIVDHGELITSRQIQRIIAEEFQAGATVPSTPSAQWISPRKDLPDEDELVLVAVTCEEGDDNDEVTQRWEEVHEATMYRGGCDLIAATADGNEYMNEEILGWMPLPAPPSGDRATQVQKEDTCTQDTRKCKKATS